MPKAHTFTVTFVYETGHTTVHVELTHSQYDTLSERRERIIRNAFNKLTGNGSNVELANLLSWAATKVSHSNCPCHHDR